MNSSASPSAASQPLGDKSKASQSGSATPASSSTRSSSFHDIAAAIAAKSRPAATATRPPALFAGLWNAYSGQPQAPRDAASVTSSNPRSSFVSHGTFDTSGSQNTRRISDRSGYQITSNVGGGDGGGNVRHPGRSVAAGESHHAPKQPISASVQAPEGVRQQNSRHGNENTPKSCDGASISSEYADNGTILGSVTSLPPPCTGPRPPPLHPSVLLPPGSVADASVAFSFTHVQTSDSVMATPRNSNAGRNNAGNEERISAIAPSPKTNSQEEEEDLLTVASQCLSLTPTMVERDLLNESGVIDQSRITTADTAPTANLGLTSALQQQTVDARPSNGSRVPMPRQLQPLGEGGEKGSLEFEDDNFDVDDEYQHEDSTSRDGTDGLAYCDYLLPFSATADDVATDGLGSLANDDGGDFFHTEENRINGQNLAVVGAAAAGVATLGNLATTSDKVVAPPATLEPDMVLCPFCQSEKDLKWHLNHERRQHSWARRILGAVLVLSLMAGSFFAGSASARQGFEPILASYAEECQAKLVKFQQEQFQRQEQLLQLAEVQRLQIAQREEMQQVAVRTEKQQQSTNYLSYIMGTDDYVSTLAVTALGGVASGLSGVFVSYFFGDGACTGGAC